MWYQNHLKTVHMESSDEEPSARFQEQEYESVKSIQSQKPRYSHSTAQENRQASNHQGQLRDKRDEHPTSRYEQPAGRYEQPAFKGARNVPRSHEQPSKESRQVQKGHDSWYDDLDFVAQPRLKNHDLARINQIDLNIKSLDNVLERLQNMNIVMETDIEFDDDVEYENRNISKKKYFKGKKLE